MNGSRGWSLLALAGAILTVMVAAPIANADAATVHSDGNRITYTGGGEANDLIRSVVEGEDGHTYIEFMDLGATTTPTGECFSEMGLEYCPFAPLMTIDLGSGNDNLRNDTPVAPDTADQILGGPGNDTLGGGPGADVISGGPGNDILEHQGECYDEGVAGADDVSGGDGIDLLDLKCRNEHIYASLDNIANDGASGEGDNYRSDIENVDGGGALGGGGTTFVGTSGPNIFGGHNSNDIARGMGGNDTLTGSCGADQLDGGAGDDRLEGACDGDTLIGGPGRDSILGDDACTGFDCTGGADVIHVRDGEADTVMCGIGPDSVTADALDLVATDGAQYCEVVDRGRSPNPDPKPNVPAKCRKLKGHKRAACVKQQKAIAKCKKIKPNSKKAKRKRAACMRKARQG